LPTQTPNASSIEIKSTRQKELDDVVDTTLPRKNNVGRPQHKQLDDAANTSSPRKNATICGHMATPNRKKQDFVTNRKRKKTDDIINATTQLVAYAAQNYRVVST
jgi:hypothetical protein